ncbi:MAG: MFS transporter [Dehalococcoidia bacterium]|nr:MFS transporter [Dehalococcoidia bacterium]
MRPPSTPTTQHETTNWAATTFASLRYRDFRYLLLSTTSLGFGQWFQQIGMGWMVYVITNSPIQIGIVATIRGLAVVVLSIPAGVLADRYDRRTLVLWATALAVLQASALAILVLFGAIQWWHLWLFALVDGISAAFNQPARSALVYDQVGPKTLENAIALTAVTNNLARVTGPTIAGMIIAWVGVSACFVTLAGLKILAFLLTMPIRPAPPASASKAVVRGWRSYMEGLVVVGRSRVLLGLLILQVIPSVLVYPYMPFVPIFTSEVLGLGKNAFAYGFLLSAVGFGSLVGAAMMAGRGSGQSGGKLMLGGAFFYMLMIMLFSLSSWLPLSFGILILAGLFNVYNLNLNQTFYQLHTPNEARGRVLAVNGLIGPGIQPIGNMVMGAGIAGWGFPKTVASFTAVAAVTTVILAVAIPEIWRLRAPSGETRR